MLEEAREETLRITLNPAQEQNAIAEVASSRATTLSGVSKVKRSGKALSAGVVPGNSKLFDVSPLSWCTLSVL